MDQWLVENEWMIRGYVFYGFLALMALWESLSPAKPSTTSTPRRWLNNFSLLIIDNLLLRLVYPVMSVVFAAYVAEHGIGLFNQVDAPYWLLLPLTLAMLDLNAWLVHVLLHRVPLLWRLHKVHHADLDYDVTTGLRFHPLESLLTVGATLFVIALLGLPPVAVVVYEIVFISTALFNHGNVHLPRRLDALLRLCFVTPDMHRIHHSVDPREGNSNFAGILSVWDRAFGTYCREPAAGQDGMVMGLGEYRDARTLNLPRLLLMPFVRTTGGTAAPLPGPGRPGKHPYRDLP